MKKGENFKVVIFAIKSFHSMQNLTGSSMVQFSPFFVPRTLVLHILHVTYFGQKTNLKVLPLDIFEAFGQYESYF